MKPLLLIAAHVLLFANVCSENPLVSKKFEQVVSAHLISIFTIVWCVIFIIACSARTSTPRIYLCLTVACCVWDAWYIYLTYDRGGIGLIHGISIGVWVMSLIVAIANWKRSAEQPATKQFAGKNV